MNLKSVYFKYRYLFAGVFLIFLINCLFSIKTDLSKGFDNYWYWWVFSEKITSDWKVNFNELEIWRGYLFPLYCAILNKCRGGGYRYFILLNSIINAVMFMYIIPSLHNEKNDFSLKSTVLSFVTWLVVFLLFRGLFIYTLSDSYALYMCILAMFFLLRYKQSGNLKKSAIFLFLSGAFAYFAYNIRSIYLFAGFFYLFLAVCFVFKKHSKIIMCILYVAVFLAGIFAASMPQAFLNYKQNGEKSMFVSTQNLMLSQCLWGIKYQRYETYTGIWSENPEQSIPQMYFPDSVGTKLLEKEQITGFGSWKDFIKFVYHYPLETAGIYVRHFVNCLFPCWPNTYVQKINNNKLFYACLSLLLVFTFCLSLFFRCIKKHRTFINWLPSMIPCLFIIPGAVESRFFLALFLLMSSTIFFNIDFRKLFASVRANAVRVCIVFIFFSALLISQWSIFLMSETEIPILMLGAKL